MRKNTKNEKVIRAITIALATMITFTASPVTALADEGAEADNNTNTSGSESSGEETATEETAPAAGESQTEETSSVEEAAEVCESAEEIIEGSNESDNSLPETIEEASSAVEAFETSFVAPEEAMAQILADLTDAAASVETTQGNIDAAQSAIEAAASAQTTADTIAATAAGSVEAVNAGIETIAEADSNADNSIAAAQTFADTANTSASRAEAVAAADSAAAELANVEADYDAASKAYESASAAADQAETEYQAAEAAYKQALAELDKTNEAIANAQGNATAAQESMKAAQAKVDSLEKKVLKLAENKAELETLRNNYYNFLIHYYRNDTKTDVYDANGEIDLDASAKKAIEEGKAVAPTINGNTLLLGRELLKELVTLKLKLGGADADSIVFAAEGYGKDAKDASLGYREKDKKGHTKVSIDNDTKYKQYWEDQSGENGRNNHAKVTYTKDGKQYTEYYNYVAKASAFEDKTDLENGTIFLALVEKGEDGKWHAKADGSEFAFDNYNKLLEAINIAAAASEDMNEYNNAKDAVDAAAAEVTRLKDQLDKLSKVSVDSSTLGKVKAALEKAQADLADAKDTRDALAGKIAQARAIVESIDLSRFNAAGGFAEIAGDVVSAAEEEANDGSAGSGEEAAPAASTAPAAVAATTTLAAATTGETAIAQAEADGTEAEEAETGVLGARTNGTSEEAVEAEEADGIADEEGFEEIKITVTPDSRIDEEASIEKDMDGLGDIVRLEENEIPLAAIPFETEDNISWWWLLIIALLGATGKAMYDNYKNKEETGHTNR